MSRSFRQIPVLSKWSILKELKPIGKLSPNQLHRIKPKWLKKLGPVMKHSGTKRFVEIYEPEDIGRLLRADGKWPLRPVLPLIELAIKRGHLQPSISHLNGSDWAEIRTKMQKIFLNQSAATQFYSQQWEVCDSFVKALGSQSEREGEVRDFRAWSCRFAAESVGKILLGAEMGSFTTAPNSPGNRLCRNMDKLFSLTAAGFIQPPCSSWYETRLYKDWIHHHRLSKLLVEELISMYGFTGVTGRGQRSAEDTEEVNDGVGTSQPIHCFFSELLARQDITEKEAAEFAEELFIAGVESTGNALTFLVYHLASNPTVQDRLYRDIQSCTTDGQLISAETFQTMSYLRACMKESMRLSPPVTGTVRTTVCDTVLSGYAVPAGTIVNTGSDVICQREEYFSNASVFDPDRWLVGRRQSIPPFAYIPFGHGARMCIGRRFAEQELMMAALMLVKEFDMRLVNKDLRLDSILKVFYSPQQTVDILLTKRRNQ